MKKAWQNPAVADLAIEMTEHRLFGNTGDGGYIGDGIISGHSKWECPSNKPGDQPDNEFDES